MKSCITICISVSPYTKVRVPFVQRMCRQNRANYDPPHAHMATQRKNITKIGPVSSVAPEGRIEDKGRLGSP